MRKKKHPILTTRYPAVLWCRTDAGEEVEFILWRGVLASEKKNYLNFNERWISVLDYVNIQFKS